MHELLIQVIFYTMAACAVGSAVMVISQNNPVRCVLFLVLTFLASSILWMLVEAEFLALILVLVYVGAVMTLFLFVVMMLNIDKETTKSHLMRHLPTGFILVALLTGLLLVSIPEGFFQSQAPQLKSAMSNTEALGMVLYTDYLLALELAAVILLVAIISAITLVHRGIVRSKRQNIKAQIMTSPSDRMKLISMKAEK